MLRSPVAEVRVVFKGSLLKKSKFIFLRCMRWRLALANRTVQSTRNRSCLHPLGYSCQKLHCPKKQEALENTFQDLLNWTKDLLASLSPTFSPRKDDRYTISMHRSHSSEHAYSWSKVSSRPRAVKYLLPRITPQRKDLRVLSYSKECQE